MLDVEPTGQALVPVMTREGEYSFWSGSGVNEDEMQDAEPTD
jgi:hypothetical protein